MSVPLLTATLFVLVESSNELDGPLTYLCSHMWVLLLSSTIVSISLLVSGLLLGRKVPVCASEGLLTGAYLMVGPSLALMGLSTSLGITAPPWLDYVTPAMLPASAWAYYRSLAPSEDDEAEEDQQQRDKNVGASVTPVTHGMRGLQPRYRLVSLLASQHKAPENNQPTQCHYSPSVFVENQS